MKRCPASSRSGFSLLELLAVVVILGIIAVIVVPRIAAPADTAKTNSKQHAVKTLNSAIEQYRVDEGDWPTSLKDLVPDYLPGGIPDPPDGGPAYTIDPVLHRVLP